MSQIRYLWGQICRSGHIPFSLQITWMWEHQPFQLEEIQLFVQAAVCCLFHTLREAEAGPAQGMLCTGTPWAWKCSRIRAPLASQIAVLGEMAEPDLGSRAAAGCLHPNGTTSKHHLIRGPYLRQQEDFPLTSVTLLHNVLSSAGKIFLLHTPAIWKSLL